MRARPLALRRLAFGTLFAVGSPAAADEPPTPPNAAQRDATCTRLPDWLPFVDVAAGLGMAVPGVLLLQGMPRNVTGGNPTAPALMLGVGGGAMLSGIALREERCVTPATPELDRMTKVVTIVTAAQATVAAGLGAAFTLSHRPGQPGEPAFAALGAIFIALTSAGATVGTHLLLVSPRGDGPATASAPRWTAAVAPAPGGAAAMLGYAF